MSSVLSDAVNYKWIFITGFMSLVVLYMYLFKVHTFTSFLEHFT